MSDWKDWIAGKCPACDVGGTLFVASGGYVTCSSTRCPNPTMVADLLGRGGNREGFRVVSADAVVINRDDIPELLIEDLESAGDCDAGSCNFCLNAMLTAARLLSGGSPAAPEEERCPTCRVDDRAHLAGTVVNDFEVCRDPWHAGSPAAPEDGTDG